MLEVCIAATLLGLVASAALGSSAMAQRDATLAALRQNAITLAEERLESAAGSAAVDDAGWQARVAAALPGGDGAVQSAANGTIVSVRWRAPGPLDTRCPGATCVQLGSRP
jgi:type II secretory pathway pseudopilin PulG